MKTLIRVESSKVVLFRDSMLFYIRNIQIYQTKYTVSISFLIISLVNVSTPECQGNGKLVRKNTTLMSHNNVNKIN